MDKTSALYQTYLRILHEELIPAMGCTEPIAIAYAAAKAREVLGQLPGSVWLGVSNNIIKNVKSVIVPNTDGMKGIEAAAAAGSETRCALLAQAERQLLAGCAAVPLFAQHKRLLLAGGVEGLVFDPYGPVLDLTWTTKQ